MAGLTRFELVNDGVKVRCLTAWLKPYKKWWKGVDSNHRTRREWIYSPPRLATSLPFHSIKTLIYYTIYLFELQVFFKKNYKYFLWRRKDILKSRLIYGIIIKSNLIRGESYALGRGTCKKNY